MQACIFIVFWVQSIFWWVDFKQICFNTVPVGLIESYNHLPTDSVAEWITENVTVRTISYKVISTHVQLNYICELDLNLKSFSIIIENWLCCPCSLWRLWRERRGSAPTSEAPATGAGIFRQSIRCNDNRASEQGRLVPREPRIRWRRLELLEIQGRTVAASG